MLHSEVVIDAATHAKRIPFAVHRQFLPNFRRHIVCGCSIPDKTGSSSTVQLPMLHSALALDLSRVTGL